MNLYTGAVISPLYAVISTDQAVPVYQSVFEKSFYCIIVKIKINAIL